MYKVITSVSLLGLILSGCAIVDNKDVNKNNSELHKSEQISKCLNDFGNDNSNCVIETQADLLLQEDYSFSNQISTEQAIDTKLNDQSQEITRETTNISVVNIVNYTLVISPFASRESNSMIRTVYDQRGLSLAFINEMNQHGFEVARNSNTLKLGVAETKDLAQKIASEYIVLYTLENEKINTVLRRWSEQTKVKLKLVDIPEKFLNQTVHENEVYGSGIVDVNVLNSIGLLFNKVFSIREYQGD